MLKRNHKRPIAVVLIFLFAFFDFAATNNITRADDVGSIQKKLDEYLDEYSDTQKDLQNSQTRLQKKQAEVGTTKNLIQKTETEISRKNQEIVDMEQKIQLNRQILLGYIQEMSMEDDDPTIDLIVSGASFDSITGNFDQMMGVKDKIMSTLSDIRDTKAQLEGVKLELADKKEDHEKLLNIQKGQQVEIQTDIVSAKATLSELDEKIDKLRSELSSLLGSSVSAKNIKDAATFASKVTGIRKDYLLGVLVVESNLGRYTGGCNFKESKMSGNRAEIFKDICDDLDYDYKKQKVSCAPSGYKGTGGAMGVAQFMPDTWRAYEDDIASVTGHNPPDPWNLVDGVVGMALKLTKVDGVKQHKKSAEAKAYCVYLAGGNWASYCDSKGVNYGEKVLYWADNYEDLMK